MLVKPLLAPTLTRKITVINYATGERLKDAHVITDTKKTITNANGEAEVLVSSEDESVRISYMGYEAQTVSFRDLTGWVQMIMMDNQLNEVVVTSKKKRSLLPYIIGGTALFFLLLPEGKNKKTLKI